RQIAQRLMLDLASFTIGAAQQVSLIDFAFILPLCRGYMNGTRSRWHMRNIPDTSIYVNDCLQYLVATTLSSKRSYLFDAFGLFLESQGELRFSAKVLSLVGLQRRHLKFPVSRLFVHLNFIVCLFAALTMIEGLFLLGEKQHKKHSKLP